MLLFSKYYMHSVIGFAYYMHNIICISSYACYSINIMICIRLYAYIICILLDAYNYITWILYDFYYNTICICRVMDPDPHSFSLPHGFGSRSEQV